MLQYLQCVSKLMLLREPLYGPSFWCVGFRWSLWWWIVSLQEINGKNEKSSPDYAWYLGRVQLDEVHGTTIQWMTFRRCKHPHPTIGSSKHETVFRRSRSNFECQKVPRNYLIIFPLLMHSWDFVQSPCPLRIGRSLSAF